MAKRLRTDQPWDAVVGASGGKPGSVARVYGARSTSNNLLSADVEPAKRGQHDSINEDDCRYGRIRDRVIETNRSCRNRKRIVTRRSCRPHKGTGCGD
jgi:hypothetical protein